MEGGGDGGSSTETTVRSWHYRLGLGATPILTDQKIVNVLKTKKNKKERKKELPRKKEQTKRNQLGLETIMQSGSVVRVTKQSRIPNEPWLSNPCSSGTGSGIDEKEEPVLSISKRKLTLETLKAFQEGGPFCKCVPKPDNAKSEPKIKTEPKNKIEEHPEIIKIEEEDPVPDHIYSNGTHLPEQHHPCNGATTDHERKNPSVKNYPSTNFTITSSLVV